MGRNATPGIYTPLVRPALASLPLLLLLSCSAAPPRTDVADVAPGDLTIEATVLVGRDVDDIDRAERRPGRYVLFPDGGLHADVGRSIDAEVRPGLTRQLERQQLAALWLVARETGLANPENGEPPGNDALIAAAPGEIVHVVTLVADDRRWRFVRMGAATGAMDPATSRFIRELAGLAWVPDETPMRLRPAVVRYDFGPDPYAMFRPPPPAPAEAPAETPPSQPRRSRFAPNATP